MEWVVTTGRTVEEATEAALDQLGVDEQDAEMEVVQEPQKGLFGRLRAEAQVRARVRPTAPRPKVDRRERRRGDRRGRDGDRSRPKKAAFAEAACGASAGGGHGPAADGSRWPTGRCGRARRRARASAGPAGVVGDAGGRLVEQQEAPAQPDAPYGRGSNGEREHAVGRVARGAELDLEAQRAAVESFLRS